MGGVREKWNYCTPRTSKVRVVFSKIIPESNNFLSILLERQSTDIEDSKGPRKRGKNMCIFIIFILK